MGRGVLAGALVGVLQGLVAVLLVAGLGAGQADLGWFAYAPPPQVVPAAPRVVQEWLLVPLVLAGLGALAVAVARRRAGSRPGRGDRRVLTLGVGGLVVAVLSVALAPRYGGVGSSLVLLGGGATMPRRYSDYAPLELSGATTTPAVVVVAGSVLGALVLVGLAGLADDRRWGRTGTAAAVVLGLVGLGVQLFRTGLAPVTLLGEVVALGLVIGALVLAGRNQEARTPPTRP
jgi:hypothetical protein